MKHPRATYRIQLTPDFGFARLKKILPYLAALGISHIYASPIFKARKGSRHGYDVVDPTAINPELGTVEEFEEVGAEAKRLGLDWIQDIVPNHMAYDSQNAMLMDVLEYGPDSQYHSFFDVDWNHPYENIRGRLVAPFLGKFYGEALENGEIKLDYAEGELTVNYYERKFPLSVESCLKFFGHGLEILERRMGPQDPEFIKFAGHVSLLKTISETKSAEEKKKQVAFFKAILRESCERNPAIAQFIAGNIKIFNGEKGRPESFDLLDELLAGQRFRLSFWKVAADETNYRRFFNINELISLRVESDEVFEKTHSLITRLADEGKICGVRIDHIDGLYNPSKYLARLREKIGDAAYIVAEKILQSDENLPDDWPVQGTTGYDFLNHVNGLFCEKKHDKDFSRIYHKFTGMDIPYETLVADKKRMMIGRDMAGDIDNLARLFKDAAGRDRYGSDITLYGLKRAMVEVMAVFPTYRTYASDGRFSDEDKEVVQRAIEAAAEKLPDHSYELAYIERFLLLNYRENANDEEKSRWLRFVMRFQQFTGPLMAKGFEDTFLYIYNRLVSLNEVGGDPWKFGFTPAEFHAFCAERRKNWPHTMNATSTHDTKRGEDVRARINVLSELPQEFERNIKTWRRINRAKKKNKRGDETPTPNAEYLIYQTLLGTWPGKDDADAKYVERIKNYVIKAVREAKIKTTWLKPNADYEKFCVDFLDAILRRTNDNKFPEEFEPFARKIAWYGFYNSLSQTLLKIAAPGVPDFFQGSELWDMNLVDPDNRRPVDWKNRAALLEKIKKETAQTTPAKLAEILSDKKTGGAKLFLIIKTLALRAAEPELFSGGDYLPLAVEGKYSSHIVAFARRLGEKIVIVACPRLLTSVVPEGTEPLGETIWGDTRIVLPPAAAASWTGALDGNNITARDNCLLAVDLFRNFPAAAYYHL